MSDLLSPEETAKAIDRLQRDHATLEARIATLERNGRPVLDQIFGHLSGLFRRLDALEGPRTSDAELIAPAAPDVVHSEHDMRGAVVENSSPFDKPGFDMPGPFGAPAMPNSQAPEPENKS